MGVSALKFFLKFEDVVEPPPEKNAATAMMQAEKARARCTLSLAPVSSRLTALMVRSVRSDQSWMFNVSMIVLIQY